MTRDQIRGTLKSIIENEIGEVVPNLSDDTKIIEQFGLDSVDVVSMVMHIERHFRIRIAHEELPTIDTIGKLLDIIEAKSAESAAAGGKAA